VQPGEPILEIGDPERLEVDGLSADAVRIGPGMRVWLERSGYEVPLEARVRRIEPTAFTEISALGVEEQRVWVIADPLGPPERSVERGTTSVSVYSNFDVKEFWCTLTETLRCAP